jgi:hypothetical protein
MIHVPYNVHVVQPISNAWIKHRRFTAMAGRPRSNGERPVLARGGHSDNPARRKPSTNLSRSCARRTSLKSGRFERRQPGSTDWRCATAFWASSALPRNAWPAARVANVLLTTPHLAATLLPTELRLRSACIEMTERDALLPQSHRGIERAQSHGVFDLLDPDVRLAGADAYQACSAPENCKVGIERARARSISAAPPSTFTRT